MIIRRHITSNFTIIPNEVILDLRLTIGARWLLTYLLSRPHDWQVQIGDIQKQAACGRDKAYALIRELVAVGWVRKDESRQKDGRWGGVEYVVMDTPGEASEPLPENPNAVEALAENQQLTKNGLSPRTESTKSSADAEGWEADFEEFWAAYPKRPNNPKQPAKAKYRHARVRLHTSRETLLTAAQSYAASRKGEDPKFTAMAATWLNQRRWEDQAATGLADPDMDISSIVAVYPAAPGDLDEVRAAITAQGSRDEIQNIAEAAQKFGLLIKRERAEGFERRVPSLAAFIKYQWREFNRSYEFCRVGMNNKLSVRPRKGNNHEDGSRIAG